MKSFAEQTELDLGAFETCIQQDSTKQRVMNDVKDAAAVGATGTPAFFINGIPMRGGTARE